MPLPEPFARRGIHRRDLDMRAYERDDGLFDVESRLLDTKPFDFIRPSAPTRAVPAGEALHDLWIRMTVDAQLVIQEIVASSDTTPWVICKEAEPTLKALVGEKVGRGWSNLVKGRLRGVASCTHLMEMLIPLATVAIQAIRPLQRMATLAEQVDSCYAFGRDREVVRVYWAQLHPDDDYKPD